MSKLVSSRCHVTDLIEEVRQASDLVRVQFKILEAQAQKRRRALVGSLLGMESSAILRREIILVLILCIREHKLRS